VTAAAITLVRDVALLVLLTAAMWLMEEAP